MDKIKQEIILVMRRLQGSYGDELQRAGAEKDDRYHAILSACSYVLKKWDLEV
jgi:hypothetical protein